MRVHFFYKVRGQDSWTSVSKDDVEEMIAEDTGGGFAATYKIFFLAEMGIPVSTQNFLFRTEVKA